MPAPNLLGGLVGNLGLTFAAPAAVGVGNYLRSPQGVLLKDRLRQGDIPGAFTALTGLGKSNAPRLKQYNPPGFDPSKTTLQDVVQSAQQVFPQTLASVDTPIQREEKVERSRIAQLSEQDPLFKKYRVAELTKAYNTASPEDKEKIGLEIWATTNPTLARKLKPGQLGYTQATSAIMSQSPLGQFQAQTGDMQYANKMDQVPGAMAGFQLQTPLTGIPTPTVPQFGASEVFAKATPIPGATEMFTDPRKFLSQEDLDQTKLALLKRAYESRLK